MIEIGTRKVWIAVVSMLSTGILTIALGYFGLLTAVVAADAFRAITTIGLAYLGINYLNNQNGGGNRK